MFLNSYTQAWVFLVQYNFITMTIIIPLYITFYIYIKTDFVFNNNLNIQL